ncbi:uncharacterized protein LOC116340807 [Contarinia nasturtii]|uniref:uncharacterized protein LOC116340807 n=1 Tax=Contarinia nasturtii TaxID=265458 RepID=UPI0012D40330|nr:uncharacterized protein LOC116340807 [Contarinia nasturtii]
MKQFLFLTILSVSLFAQVTVSEELTFSDLLNKFYTKVAEKKIKLKVNLDFIAKISNIGDICSDKAKLHNPDGFITFQKMEEVLKKVPKNKKINGIDAQKFLYQEIMSINQTQTSKMSFSNLNICGGIEFKIQTEYDKFFEESYEQWNKDPIKSDLVERVENAAASMESGYKAFQFKFDADMKSAEDLRKTIQTDLNAVKSLFEELLNSKPAQATKIFDKVKPLILRITTQQLQLIALLKKVSDLLQQYNIERVKWADVIVGIRKAPTAPRKQLLKVFYRHLSKEIREDALKCICGTNYINKRSP